MTLLYPPSLDSVKPAFLAKDKKLSIPFSRPSYANWPEETLAINVRAVQQSNNKSILKNLDKDIRKTELVTKTIKVNDSANAVVIYNGSPITLNEKDKPFLTQKDIIDYILLTCQYKLTELYYNNYEKGALFLNTQFLTEFDLMFNNYKSIDDINDFFQRYVSTKNFKIDTKPGKQQLANQLNELKTQIAQAETILSTSFSFLSFSTKYDPNIIEWFYTNIFQETGTENFENAYKDNQDELNALEAIISKIKGLIPVNSSATLDADLNSLKIQMENRKSPINLHEIINSSFNEIDYQGFFNILLEIIKTKQNENINNPEHLVDRERMVYKLNNLNKTINNIEKAIRTQYSQVKRHLSTHNWGNIDLTYEFFKYIEWIDENIFAKESYLNAFDFEQYIPSWGKPNMTSLAAVASKLLNQKTLTATEKLQILIYVQQTVGIDFKTAIWDMSEYAEFYKPALEAVFDAYAFSTVDLEKLLDDIAINNNEIMFKRFHIWFSDLNLDDNETKFSSLFNDYSSINLAAFVQKLKEVITDNDISLKTQEHVQKKLEWIFTNSNADITWSERAFLGTAFLSNETLDEIWSRAEELGYEALVNELSDEWFFNRKELFITLIDYTAADVKAPDDLSNLTYDKCLSQFIGDYKAYQDEIDKTFNEALNKKYNEIVTQEHLYNPNNLIHLVDLYHGLVKNQPVNFKQNIDNVLGADTIKYYGYDFNDLGIKNIIGNSEEFKEAAVKCIKTFLNNENVATVPYKLFLYATIGGLNYDDFLTQIWVEVENSKEYQEDKAKIDDKFFGQGHKYFAALVCGWLKAEVERGLYGAVWSHRFKEYQEKVYNILGDYQSLFLLKSEKDLSLDYTKLPSNVDYTSNEDLDKLLKEGKIYPSEDKWPKDIRNFVKQNINTINSFQTTKESLYIFFNNFNIFNPFATLSKKVNSKKDNINKISLPITILENVADKNITSFTFDYSIYTKGWFDDDTYYVPIQLGNTNDMMVLNISNTQAQFNFPEEDAYIKIQMRIGYAPGFPNGSSYAADYTEWSEWSTVMVSKVLTNTPILNLNGTFLSDDTIKYEPSTTPLFAGQFEYDGEEYLDKYRFILYKKIGNKQQFLEQTDWIQANGNLMECRFKRSLENRSEYHTVLEIQTNNLYSMQKTLDYQVYESFLDEKQWGNGVCVIQLTVEDGNTNQYCAEEGCIQIRLNTLEKITGNIIISRVSEKDNFSSYEPIYRLEARQNQFNNKLLFTDFNIESGVKYKYIIQKENSSTGLRTPPKYVYKEFINEQGKKDWTFDESAVFYTHLEYCYLFDGETQLKLKYDESMSSYKQTILSSKQDTLGSKYPIVMRNGMANYAEFPVGGLITLHMDENQNFFVEKNDGYYYKNELVIPVDRYTEESYANMSLNQYNKDGGKYIGNLQTQDDYVSYIYGQSTKQNNFSTNLTEENIYIERKFREKVIEFLTQTDIFLYRSPDVGNKIISLINVAFQPKENLDRMIYAFTSTGYEVLENTIQNLIDYDLWQFNENEDVVVEGELVQVGQWAEILQPGENLIDLIKFDVSAEEDGDVSLTKAIGQIQYFWIEPYPLIDIEYQRNQIKAALSATAFQIQVAENEDVIKELNVKITELQEELIKIDELEKVLTQEDYYSGFSFIKNNEVLKILPNRIYASNENISSLKLSDDNPRAFIFNYVYRANWIEDAAKGLYGQTIRKVWGQLNGLFTNIQKDIKMYETQTSSRAEVNVYDDLEFLNEIQRDVLSSLFTKPDGGYYNYTDFTEESNNTWLLKINDMDSKRVIFNELQFLEIEANKGTKVNILNNNGEIYKTFLIGPTERLCFDFLSEWKNALPEMAFSQPTAAMINYEYEIQILSYGKGGVQINEKNDSE